MGTSIEGLQVQGVVRCSRTSTSNQLIIELQPHDETLDQFCGFCFRSTNTDENRQNSSVQDHSHEIRGSFSLILDKNMLRFVITECSRKGNLEIDVGNVSRTSEKLSEADLMPNVLQYQVDGKVFELKRRIPMKKSKSMKKPVKPQLKQVVDNVIEDDASGPNGDSAVFSEPCDEPSNQISLENALKNLQVKLLDEGIVPDTIACGPDTPTFLQNMRELAKLIGANQPSFKCEQCGEQLSSYFPYIEHVFRHTGTRPYVCSVCSSSFQTRAVMRHHLDMHGGKAPFQCEFCGKKFRNSCHMKQHRMRHTGEKPHLCPYCDKTFAHKNVLKMHMQSHTGEKPCCCDLCGKLFREPHRLACHLATHKRKPKSFECEQCGSKFKSSNLLDAHTAKCKQTKTSESKTEKEATLTTLQNATFVAALSPDETFGDQEVAIIEAEAIDGTVMLPGTTYLVEPAAVPCTMLVQFAIDTECASESRTHQPSGS